MNSFTFTQIRLAKKSPAKIALADIPETKISLADIFSIEYIAKSLSATLTFLTLVK